MDIIVAENLKKLREKHNLTQEALALEWGVPELAIYKWEAGRLPVEYKMLQRIADFYDVTVETFFVDDSAEKHKPSANDKVSFNCRICGGDLVYDYASTSCRCANCGNKWAIAELYPKYSHAIATINKAGRILSSKAVLASADEAKLLYKQAINECSRIEDAISSDLIKICDDGVAEAEKLETYCRGKYFFDNRSYKSALKELEKVRGYRDADVMIRRCKGEKYPLVEWGITEAQALQICYDRGFDFGGLYEIYNRASCWCCPFQRIGELRKLRRHHPELWQKLRDLDRRAREQFGPGPLGQFKKDWSLERLEERFAKEELKET